ncbi:amino acid transporter-like protein [Tricladium varicosporioides]|nr:amino acid transporter-like protein [Hymenoscyphus varicosporioides]
MGNKTQIQDGEIELGESDSPRLESHGGSSQDNIQLNRTGKRPVLKRNFGWVSILGFSCIILGTWQGSLITFGIGFMNGGPAGLIYGFLFVWAGTLATFTSLAELVSIAPTSGGQYHWVSMLAPISCQKVLSYITGWLTVIGWQAAVASSLYITGTLIQGMIQLCVPDYTPKLWQGTLLFYSILLLCIFINTIIGTTLPKIEATLLIVWFLGIFACFVPLIWLAPHATPRDVFTTFLNEGGWDSKTLSFFIGLSGNAFAFTGADSAYHMSEEIKNAAYVVPRAIILSIVINGVVGFGSMIGLLFCLGDLEALSQTPFLYPFFQVFLSATNSVAGTAVMVTIVLITDLGLAIGAMAAASRMLWAFARDRGVPAWRTISKVNSKSSIPTVAIVTTTTFSLLIGLISVGSPTAFNGVVSLTLAALYSSYLIACVLLLWRRCTGTIKSAQDDKAAFTNMPGSAGNLTWGPFRIQGLIGILINIFAIFYILVILIFTFCPPKIPVTAVTMNYSSLVFGATALLSGLYYIFWAHKTYKGPVIEIDISQSGVMQ